VCPSRALLVSKSDHLTARADRGDHSPPDRPCDLEKRRPGKKAETLERYSRDDTRRADWRFSGRDVQVSIRAAFPITIVRVYNFDTRISQAFVAFTINDLRQERERGGG
jgi:hypothetical protein